ncbi:hypothetical protein FRX31_029820 [Thalictrum thalictroides]|uniref:Uncharacterized protein n=1 Tax=Thalictrum thalictroides TaxID=46969 RepID=A0A7J6V873_THATH|nr:hypothetical protein FRX31_029820 [Thalictrum thalictroides]
MDEESEIKRFQEGGTIKIKDCTTSMSILQMKRMFKLEKFRVKEIDNIKEECNENQVVCTYAQLNWGLMFPLEEDLARLISNWGLPPIQIPLRCYMIYARAKKLEFYFKRRFGYEELRRIMRVTSRMDNGRLIIAHNSEHPKYDFYGVLRSYKMSEKKIYMVEGGWNKTCYNVLNEYKCERFVVNKASKNAQVEENLAFYFDSGRDKRLFDLSYEDVVVDMIYEQEMEKRILHSNVKNKGVAIIEEDESDGNDDTLVLKKFEKERGEKQKKIEVAPKVVRKKLKKKVIMSDDEQDDEIDITALSDDIAQEKSPLREFAFESWDDDWEDRGDEEPSREKIQEAPKGYTRPGKVLKHVKNVMSSKEKCGLELPIEDSEEEELPLRERRQQLLKMNGKVHQKNNVVGGYMNSIEQKEKTNEKQLTRQQHKSMIQSQQQGSITKENAHTGQRVTPKLAADPSAKRQANMPREVGNGLEQRGNDVGLGMEQRGAKVGVTSW